MAQKTSIAATARAKAGKGAARAVRRNGSIPAVIYGDHKEPVLISLNTKDLIKQLTNKQFFTHLCDLTVDGQTHLVIPRDIQLHPVTDRPEHADFLRVSDKTIISVEVPVRVTNEKTCKGIIAGGVLNLVHHTIEVYCKATEIPEEFVVDLAGLEIGDSVHIEDLKLPKGTEATQEGNFTVATIVAPTQITVEEENEDAATAAASAAASAPAPAAGAAKAAAPAAPAKK